MPHLNYQHNRWQGKPAGEKLVWSGGLLALAMFLPVYPGCLFVLITAAALALLSARIGPKVYFCLLLYPMSFILLGALVTPLSLSLDGGLTLRFSALDPLKVLEPGLRSLSAFCSMILLPLTTPSADLLPFLNKILPEDLTELVVLTHRLIFVFCDTTEQMRQAQDARLGYCSMPSAYRSLSSLLAALLLRTLDRCRRLESGLSARGLGRSLCMLSQRQPCSPNAVASTVLLLALIAGLSLSWRGCL